MESLGTGLWRVFFRDVKTGYFHEVSKDCVTQEAVADAVRKARAINKEVKVLNITRMVMLTPEEIQTLVQQ